MSGIIVVESEVVPQAERELDALHAHHIFDRRRLYRFKPYTNCELHA